MFADLDTTNCFVPRSQIEKYVGPGDDIKMVVTADS